MDWSRIKTIFIITFLILDVYLLFQFMKSRDVNNYEIYTEATVEQQLKDDQISYGELPTVQIKAQYLSAKPKEFTKNDLGKLKSQMVTLSDSGTTLQAILDKPYQLSEKVEPSEVQDFLRENVLNGEKYLFWKTNEKKNTITCYQQYENAPLYQNINGMITLEFNADHQIISYQQTYLGDILKMSSKEEEILTALKAIETLHQKGDLKPKSKITKVELGYSTLVQLAASQVLAPTWRVVVNDKESLYVNAFEGKIIDFNSDEKTSVE
ncbi:two-component system regulatory protein YycI [Neobacillus dielmonensis]|uniref:two-component system regulatory protein YycI n=1 Tax=Neobacillus dielmonensis TaxID=1347369 RepID=UPI0005A976D8|nr:two-component system regulatory protein YycI [Neobacillus dielmonensis]